MATPTKSRERHPKCSCHIAPQNCTGHHHDLVNDDDRLIENIHQNDDDHQHESYFYAAPKTAHQFRIKLLPLLYLVGFTLLASISLIGPDCATATITSNNTNNISNALSYTRTRFDLYYLPIFKKLQKKRPFEEQVVNVIATNENNKTYRYFVNSRVDVRSLTEDDLVLEALDESYRSRLVQPYLHDYDNPKDRLRSSDPLLVDPVKCQRELEYLVRRLDEWQPELRNAQTNGSSSKQPRGLDPELATFFDSYGQEEAGVLLGNFYWTGNWRQCNRRHILHVEPSSDSSLDNLTLNAPLPAQVTSFTGRYCSVALRAPSWEKNIELKIKKMEEAKFFKYDGHQEHFRKFFRLQVGICLPQSCDSSLWLNRTQMELVRRLTMHKLRKPFADYNLAELYCLPDAGSELRRPNSSGWALIILLIVWLIAICAASWADHMNLAEVRSLRANENGKSLAQKLIISLSIQESYRVLMTIKRHKKKQKPEAVEPNGSTGPEVLKPSKTAAENSDMSFLNAIKVVLIVPILMGHIGMMCMQQSITPLDFNSVPMIWFHWMSGSTFYVDWYFCISAFITTYSMFVTKLVQNNTLSQWIYSVFHRYWRLMPAYLLIFWFSRSLYHLVGEGPLWDYGTNSEGLRAVCKRESWLYPLLLAPNLHPLHQECIMPSWYLGSDIQFYLVTPPLLVALNKSPRFGWLLALLSMSASVVLRFYKYSTDSKYQLIDMMRPRFDLVMRNNFDQEATYLHPQYRISSYLLGLLAGHYCYMVRSGQWSSPLYSETLQQFASKSKLTLDYVTRRRKRIDLMHYVVLILGLTIGGHMTMSTWSLSVGLPAGAERWAHYLVPLFYGLSHPAAGLAATLITVSLILGDWPRLSRLLNNRLWTLMSRVNYFVFLYQVEFIAYLLQTGNRIPDLGMTDHVAFCVFLLPVLYAFAYAATLLLSNPLAKLESEFVGAYFFKPHKKVHAQTKGVGTDRGDGDRNQVEAATGSGKPTRGLIVEMEPISSSLEAGERDECQATEDEPANGK